MALDDWNQLRLILAIARAGTLAGAARHLGVSHATAYRRLGRLEAALGETLFTRGTGGYTATAAGRRLVAAAETAEAAITHAAEAESTQPARLTVATTELLFEGLVAELLSLFQAMHPDIALDIVIDGRVENLAHRRVDIAIRPGNTPPDYLIGRPVGTITQAVYRLVDKPATPAPCWVMPDTQSEHTALLAWHRTQRHARDGACYVNTEMGARRAVLAGLGQAVLPTYIGEGDPRLVRVAPPIEALATQCWLLHHPALRAHPLVSELSATLGPQLGQRLAGLEPGTAVV